MNAGGGEKNEGIAILPGQKMTRQGNENLMGRREQDVSETLPDDESGDDLDEPIEGCSMAVECICPKCGVKHVVNFRWIGRGTPRKFCRSCKGRIG